MDLEVHFYIKTVPRNFTIYSVILFGIAKSVLDIIPP